MNGWTTELPTETGWYFAYEALDPIDADVFVVFWMGGKATSQGVEFEPSHFSHWWKVPIELPPPPQGA